jgi:hypothetical protein
MYEEFPRVSHDRGTFPIGVSVQTKHEQNVMILAPF